MTSLITGALNMTLDITYNVLGDDITDYLIIVDVIVYNSLRDDVTDYLITVDGIAHSFL